MLEIGAGIGCYTYAMRAYGTNVEAYDGAPHIYKISHGLVSHADLTVPLIQKPRAWVLCLEVAEHIPIIKEQVLVNNLNNLNCKGIVLSWASNRNGNMHLNPRPNGWVVDRFSA